MNSISIKIKKISYSILGIVGIIIALPCYLLLRTTYNFFHSDLKKGMDLVKENI